MGTALVIERFADDADPGQAVNPVFAEVLEKRRVVARDGAEIPIHSEISTAEGETLQRLIRQLRPEVTLEVGCAYGISALYICEALAEVGGRKHIIIDPHQLTHWKGAGLFTLERAGFASLVEFHALSSHIALPRLEMAGTKIGLALIDGWHTFDYAMIDFFYVDRLLQVGGVVMLDDTAAYAAIRKLARYIATHRQYVALKNDGLAPAHQACKAPVARRSGVVHRLAERLLHPKVVHPDSRLGLPADNFIAFKKTAEDLLGDGSGGSRRWDQHHEF
jgi:predicted O-methyltransferase YrrM